jgi:hypothetical protein
VKEKSGKTPVVWDEAERLAIATVCMERMEEGYALTQMMIVTVGKELLSKDRHRNFCGPTDKVWVLDIIAQIKKANRTLKAAIPVHQPEGDILSRPVATLELSPAARRRLINNGMKTIGDVCSKSRADLLSLIQFGTKKVDDIEVALKTLKLSLGQKMTSVHLPEVVKPNPHVELPIVHETAPANLDEAFAKFTSSIDLAARDLGIDIGLHVLATAEKELPQVISMMKPYLMEKAATSVTSMMKDSVSSYLSGVSAKTSTGMVNLKVVVVGARNNSAAILKNQFGSRFKKLTVWDAEQGMDILHNNLEHADEVIVMTSWCSHTAHEKVKTRFKGTPRLVNGGNTELFTALETLAA